MGVYTKHGTLGCHSCRGNGTVFSGPTSRLAHTTAQTQHRKATMTEQEGNAREGWKCGVKIVNMEIENVQKLSISELYLICACERACVRAYVRACVINGGIGKTGRRLLKWDAN